MNTFLKANQVVVAIEHLYNDNDGAYSVATTWDTVEKTLGGANYSNGYNNVAHDAARVDATAEQKAEAVAWYKANVQPDHCNLSSYIGHTYLVKRSRKIKKGTKVIVLNVHDRQYNARFNTYDPERALVEVVEPTAHHEAAYRCWISLGCLDEWLVGAEPWWASKGGM